jgi:hypothetical protein
MHLATATLLAAAVLGPASAQAITYTVDCSKGQSIGDALQRGDARKPLTLLIRGTCNEYVAIARDDVTLRGDPAGGGAVNGPGSAAPAILIESARTSIEELTVTGGASGILVAGPFAGALTNVVVRNPAAGSAVVVRAGGDLSITGCTLMQASIGLQLMRGGSARVLGNTQIHANAGDGIYVDLNSSLNVSGGTKVFANGSHGIELGNGSQGTITNSEISGNLSGIVVAASGARIGGGNLIVDNRGDGVVGYLGSTLVLQGNEIARNVTGVACRADCTLQIAGANIHDNASQAVVVMLGSTAIFAAPETHATGNGWVDLWCGDTESSVDGVDGLSVDGGDFFDGSVSPTCTGFSD